METSLEINDELKHFSLFTAAASADKSVRANPQNPYEWGPNSKAGGETRFVVAGSEDCFPKSWFVRGVSQEGVGVSDRFEAAAGTRASELHGARIGTVARQDTRNAGALRRREAGRSGFRSERNLRCECSSPLAPIQIGRA